MSKKRTGLGGLTAASVAIGSVVVAAMVGRRASPTPDHPGTRRWYRDLKKPEFTPPPPVYGFAWTGIQAGLAYGGYRLLRRPSSSARTLALTLWGINQAAIASWSEIFFGYRAPGAGTVAAGVMIGTAAGYVTAAAREDEPAAIAGVPLLVWVSFATLLAEEIWRRND